MKRLIMTILCLFLCLGIAGCASRTNETTVPSDTEQRETETVSEETPQQTEGTETTFSADTLILDVINDPVFAGYGRFLFPIERQLPDDDMQISDMEALFRLHNNINITTAVNTLNAMRQMAENGDLEFYDIYTEDEKANDPAKEETGLFFFHGEANAPFAVINASGGFSYVASLHTAFPHAVDLNGKGYNAFVLQYRTGRGQQAAAEDLARALSFVFENAEELQVSTEDYSLWGGSAGGQMVARISSYGTASLGGDDLPAAAAIIMQYTAYQDYTGNEPPTFACIGDSDSISDPNAMKRRIDNLSAAGIDTEFHIYPGLDHGWGYGTGTSAEGWIDDAVAFWEDHMSNHEGRG